MPHFCLPQSTSKFKRMPYLARFFFKIVHFWNLFGNLGGIYKHLFYTGHHVKNKFIFRLLVAHVAPGSLEESWKGYLYSGLLLVTSLAQTIFGVQHMKRMMLIGMRTRSVLSSAIYRKSLIVSSASKKDTTAGEIVNLMSVDSKILFY